MRHREACIECVEGSLPVDFCEGGNLHVESLLGAWNFQEWLNGLSGEVKGLNITGSGQSVHSMRIVQSQDLALYSVKAGLPTVQCPPEWAEECGPTDAVLLLKRTSLAGPWFISP